MVVEFCQRLSLHEIIILFLSFNLLMWYITLNDLRILINPCIPRIKPTWSRCMIFLICCWILFARILLRIFASMFISDIGLQFSFLCVMFFGFGSRVMVASQNVFGRLPSSAIFWKSLNRIGVSSSLNFWQNLPVLLSVERFFTSLVAQRLKSVCLQGGRLGSIPGLGRCPGEGNSNPLQYSCMENPVDGEAWQATVHGVAKSQT